jgi:UDP-N-acetylglucosamine transferase subunit ALG13
MRRARVVVTHAGVGTVMVALAEKKRAFVVPRLKTFAEAVDDHQLQLARRFAEAGLVTVVEEPEQLASLLVTERDEPVSVGTASSALAEDLRTYLELAVA